MRRDGSAGEGGRVDCPARTKRALSTSLLLGIILYLYIELQTQIGGGRTGSAPAPGSAGASGVSGSGTALRPGSGRAHAAPGPPARAAVVARYREDTSWVDVYFADLPHFVFTPGKPETSVYTTEVNAGNEAAPFLKFILDHYSALPEATAFVHGHRISHHTYQLDVVIALKGLRWDAVVTAGFLPLNVHMYQRVNAGNPEFGTLREVWPRLFADISPAPPAEIGAWCCAQFAVSRERIRARPRAFYARIYEWLQHGGVSSWMTSRVLEQTWHLIFGLPAVAQPVEPCAVFDCAVLDEWEGKLFLSEGSALERIPEDLHRKPKR